MYHATGLCHWHQQAYGLAHWQHSSLLPWNSLCELPLPFQFSNISYFLRRLSSCCIMPGFKKCPQPIRLSAAVCSCRSICMPNIEGHTQSKLEVPTQSFNNEVIDDLSSVSVLH